MAAPHDIKAGVHNIHLHFSIPTTTMEEEFGGEWQRGAWRFSILTKYLGKSRKPKTNQTFTMGQSIVSKFLTKLGVLALQRLPPPFCF